MADMPAGSAAKGVMDVPFEFLGAKLRARRRLVYEGARLKELATAHSVEELARRLYPREAISTRLELERRLRTDCVRELTFFLHYLSSGLDRFYLALLRRFQVEDIQTLLRVFAGGEEEPELERFLPALPAALALAVGDLMQSKTLEEFCGKLPGPFASAAGGALEVWERSETTAFVEMAVERAFWEELTRSLGQVPAPWGQACARPTRSELRTMRVLTVLRAARIHGVEWGDVENVLPPSGTPSRGLLRAMHGDPSPGNVVACVPLLRALSQQDAGRIAGSLVELEGLCWGETFRLANRLYYGEMEGPGVLVGYYYLRRNELKELTALVESLHYGRSPAARSGDAPVGA